MPTYEYKCDACGYEFEQFQSIKAAPIKRCPQCGKAKVRRLIGTGAGLIFKGSGFYITDYRSEQYKSAAKSAEGGGAGGETKPAAGGDAKPAAASSTNADKPAASPATPAAPAGPSKPAPSGKAKKS